MLTVVHAEEPGDSLCFAVGRNGCPASSVWLMRSSSREVGGQPEAELFVFNLDAGDAAAKISFHCSSPSGHQPRVFFRYTDEGGAIRTPSDWEWPATYDVAPAVRRLAGIAIPAACLDVPLVHRRTAQRPILIPPPSTGQVEVDIFAEAGPSQVERLPISTSTGSTLLGQLIFRDETTREPMYRFFAVWRYSPFDDSLKVEGDEVLRVEGVQLSHGSRYMILKLKVVDGQELPVLVEAPEEAVIRREGS